MKIALESPGQPDVGALIAALDAEIAPLYPPASHYGIDAAALAQSHVRFAVARDDAGRAIGCGAIVLQGGYGEIKRMYVIPDARRRGVGTRILAFLEAQARAAGYHHFKLETGRQQPDAIAVYEPAGYMQCGRFGGYPDDPHCVFMAKPAPGHANRGP